MRARCSERTLIGPRVSPPVLEPPRRIHSLKSATVNAKNRLRSTNTKCRHWPFQFRRRIPWRITVARCNAVDPSQILAVEVWRPRAV
eukprot:11168423-Lingulodinium_polyedra.AAC.1